MKPIKRIHRRYKSFRRSYKFKYPVMFLAFDGAVGMLKISGVFVATWITVSLLFPGST